MKMVVDKEKIHRVGEILCNSALPMKARYRALFTLRNLGGELAIDAIAANFNDESSLLRHEMAYCLGQMQDSYALCVLRSLLKDEDQPVIVRHEAAEALGAIGDQNDLPLLAEYSRDCPIELAETCQIAVERMKWLSSISKTALESLPSNPYDSVDPAPPLPVDHVSKLAQVLMDESLTLFERYRAMFTLRNMGTDDSIAALTTGFKDKSALFRHEIAYVLGQLSSPLAEQALTLQLRNLNEHGMVRHECAEALGAVATESSLTTLKTYLNDQEKLVRESCEVALDMGEYHSGEEFEYANTMIVTS